MIVAATLAWVAATLPAWAEVAHVEVRTRTPVLDGRAFGATGPYEKLTGRIVFLLDPAHPANAQLADIDKAPRTAGGRVECASEFVLLRPLDAARGNGIAILDVVNRGNPQLLSAFNFASGSGDPTTASEFGDGYLLRAGYTLVAIGWEASPTGPVAHDPPVATDKGQPIAGWVSNWFVAPPGAKSFDLTSAFWTGLRPYPPLDPSDPEAKLTKRQGFFGKPQIVPRARWKFGRVVDGAFVDDPRHVFVEDGLESGSTYEVRYRTRDPRVPTGLAAIRDTASLLKHGAHALLRAKHVVAYGASQTGRFLRAFLHEGYTTDEQGRQVIDAFWIHIGGASLGSFNERFVQASEGGFFTTSRFPFLYETTKDPVTGREDGLGTRVPAGLHPKVFFVDSSNEYWDRGRVTALNHVTLDGRSDAVLPGNVRFYHMAGTQHSPGTFPPAADPLRQLATNVLDQRPIMRALLAALEGWVRTGASPPASRHPTIASGGLVAQRDIRFPAVRGVQWPYNVLGGFRSDLPGDLKGHPLPFLVPQVDGDGNEVGGVRLPDVAVPLATHSGWAFRSASAGSPEQLSHLMGSYLPLARSREDREARGDPRPSIAERYASREEYLRQYEAAARALIAERFLLEEDLARTMARGAAHWDLLMGSAVAAPR